MFKEHLFYFYEDAIVDLLKINLYFLLFKLMRNTQVNENTHLLFFLIENGEHAKMMYFIIN